MVEPTSSGWRAFAVSMAVLLGLLIAIVLLPDRRSVGILALIVLHGTLLMMTMSHMAGRVNRPVELLSDGRFYLFIMLFLYAVSVPLLSIVDGQPAPRLLLLPHIRTRVTSEATIMYSQLGSILLYVGAFLGAFLVWRRQEENLEPEPVPRRTVEDPSHNHGIDVATWYWAVISAISTLVFILPFLLGGFDVLRQGGTVIEIDGFSTIAAGSLPLTVIGFLFSAEVMTGSTLVLMLVLYLRYVRGGGTLALLLLVGMHLVLALVTTRTIRAVIFAFAICVLASLPGPPSRKTLRTILVPMPLIVLAVGALNLAPSLLDESNVDYETPTSVAGVLRSADPSGPYDAYFRALEQEPSLDMALNAPVSLVSSIPFVGSSLLEAVGLDPEPPLATWLRGEYPEIYAVGGGLAAMPQIEGYLTAGLLGCFATGAVMGLLSRMSRTVLGTLFVVALSVLFARGSLGVLAQLAVPYGLVVLLLFGVVIPRMLRLPSIGEIRDLAELARCEPRTTSMELAPVHLATIPAQHRGRSDVHRRRSRH